MGAEKFFFITSMQIYLFISVYGKEIFWMLYLLEMKVLHELVHFSNSSYCDEMCEFI